MSLRSRRFEGKWRTWGLFLGHFGLIQTPKLLIYEQKLVELIYGP